MLCREEEGEAEGDKGSRLGHCTGLLVIDVAAHATSVDSWRDQKGRIVGEQSGVEQRDGGETKVKQKQERLLNISCTADFQSGRAAHKSLDEKYTCVTFAFKC